MKIKLSYIKLLTCLLLISCEPNEKKTHEGILDTITFPTNGATFLSDEKINFICQSENQNITWHSSIIGEIGQGKKIAIFLTPGVHEISIGAKEKITITIIERTFSTGQTFHFKLNSSSNQINIPDGFYIPYLISTSPLLKRNQTVNSKFRQNFNNNTNHEEIKKKLYKHPESNVSYSDKYILKKRNAVPHRKIGDIKEFRIIDIKQNSSEITIDINAQLIYENEIFLLWKDTQDDIPKNINLLISNLEKSVPQVFSLFGESSDVDNDSKFSILLTSLINKSEIAIGFFNSSDLYPHNNDRKSDNFNPSSNEMEVIYAAIPDESSFAYSIPSISATIIHELQHLIHYNEKTFKYHKMGIKNPLEEDLFLAESLAHLAEALCGFGVSGGNILFVERYLRETNSYSLIYQDIFGNYDSIGKRGAGVLFLSYLFWRAGGIEFNDGEIINKGGITFLRSILNSQNKGWASLTDATGINADILFNEWASYINNSDQLQDFANIYHPNTKELVNIPLQYGPIKISEESFIYLKGAARNNILSYNLNDFPYSLTFFEKLYISEKERIMLNYKSGYSNLSLIFLCSE